MGPIAHMPGHWLTHTPTHLIAFRRVRIRRYHIKAALAYGGALLMGVDATIWIIPHIVPHTALILASLEPVATGGGKVGAACGGFAAFFDRIIAAGVAEASGASA